MFSAFPSTTVYPVRKYQKRIFLNYAWAIPCFICLAIWVFCAVLSLVTYLFCRPHSLVRLPDLRALINQLSVGRPLVSAYDQSSFASDHLSTEEWVSTAGQEMIDLYQVTEAKGEFMIQKRRASV